MRDLPGAFRSQPAVVSILLAAILVTGLWLRISNLGGPDFGVDETFHVFAAERLIAGDPPLLPSGLPYDRSLPYTRMVAWSGGLFGGVNEWTARLPSVLFGCLSILVVFAIGWRWYSATAGLIAAWVMAVAPMQISHSRQVRMYALLQLLYLIIIYLLYQGIETSAPATRRWLPPRLAGWCRRLEIRPELIVIAIPFILLARQIHDLILPSLVGTAAYILCVGLVAPFVRSVTPMARRKYWVAAALLVAGGFLVVSLDIGGVRGMVAYAHSYAPTWAQPRTADWRYYLNSLGERYPMIFGTFLLASVFALTRNWKPTLYLLACFTVPFLLHSFLFAWKETRYVMHITPLMFIVFGVGVSVFLSNLYQALAAWARQTLDANPQKIAGTLTAAAVVFLFGATTELREGVKLHNVEVGMFAEVQHFNWKKAMEFIAARATAGDTIITSRSLAARYYGPSLPSYLLNHQELDSVVTDYPRNEEGQPLDYSTRDLVILNLDMLRDVIGRHSSGWFVTERPQLGSASIPDELATFIERNLSQERVPEADDMAVFSWGHEKKPDASSLSAGTSPPADPIKTSSKSSQ
jgi:hypothetical protein